MKLRFKILNSLLGLALLSIVGLAVLLSYESDCAPAPPVAADVQLMTAVVSRCYGPPSVLNVESIAKPEVATDQVLVRVRAAAVNPLDWHYMRGKPYMMRLSTGIGAPNDARVGVDFAGVVEAVGPEVSRFKIGDEVFGGRSGALAEYISVGQDRNIVLKPANVSFEQAAAVAIAGVTALQALRDEGQLQAGQSVLINGASGGVGTFAVQIAKAMGAQVTAVCSGRNEAMVRSIGADQVIDYKQADFTAGDKRYDLIVDMIGNHTLSAIRGVLTDNGRLVIVGGPKDNAFLGPLPAVIWASLSSNFVNQQMGMMLAELRQSDLQQLAEMMQQGQLTPVIDRRFALAQAAQAIEYLELGHASGKVIVTID